MKKWIEKDIDPPGLEKKNRGALFTAIAKIFDMVKKDAIKAFNAHFPYLSDSAKLKRHGKSLSIPELPEDTEDGYRTRVSAASFYLMRAGERGYCLEQLHEHFGDRFILSEEFLQVYVKIIDLNDADKAWVTSFLDGMLNPNIQMAFAEWFQLADTLLMEEMQKGSLWRTDTDVIRQGLCCDGRFLCDQGKATLCDGSLKCDGSWDCEDFQAARGTIYDTVMASVFPNGAYRCDGSFDCSGYVKIYEPENFPGPIFPTDKFDEKFLFDMELERLEDRMRINPLCDGSWACDGSNLAAMADAPMTIRVKTSIRCDGSRTPSCSVCDGTWQCNGSHTCFDGWYCSEDIIREEVIV